MSYVLLFVAFIPCGRGGGQNDRDCLIKYSIINRNAPCAHLYLTRLLSSISYMLLQTISIFKTRPVDQKIIRSKSFISHSYLIMLLECCLYLHKINLSSCYVISYMHSYYLLSCLPHSSFLYCN